MPCAYKTLEWKATVTHNTSTTSPKKHAYPDYLHWLVLVDNMPVYRILLSAMTASTDPRLHAMVHMWCRYAHETSPCMCEGESLLAALSKGLIQHVHSSLQMPMDGHTNAVTNWYSPMHKMEKQAQYSLHVTLNATWWMSLNYTCASRLLVFIQWHWIQLLRKTWLACHPTSQMGAVSITRPASIGKCMVYQARSLPW